MTRIAATLARRQFILRSGGAMGADLAFEDGADTTAHIYLAWGYGTRWPRVTARRFDVGPGAMSMASAVHPAWNRLSSGAKKLHARNCYQVLGEDLKTPSEFLVCWTPDGCIDRATRTRDSGGTATAIVLAAEHGVPVFNLQREGAVDALRAHIRTTAALGTPVSPGHNALTT